VVLTALLRCTQSLAKNEPYSLEHRWDFDLLFRHPFELSKKVEFEPGIGPTMSSSGQFGAVASFEFMIWPWQERKFGWFVDPSYNYSFGRAHRQSLQLGVGLLFGFQ
jgi:hypothetical protein